MSTDQDAMALALAQAREAGARGDVPVGAVLLSPAGELLAAAGNRRQIDGDPTAHAEILALRAAGVAPGDWRMSGCTLVVTLEPCTMCAGAIVLARLDRLVLGAWDEKAGACGSTRDVVRDSRLNHQVQVTGGVRAEESTRLLTAFFTSRRGAAGEEPPQPAG
ncbi:MAG TPA: nucleoside deaminase [Candidatus Ruania gallistercoris]|uniref:tRNA-specific adenosine deaminase n=1 Tax=Candidatus Ruania gallistercoris TaxID=2838746 RepID=A0A9D2EAY7_9MICO|nr:nucleoside deaminase [Candidatus Ruania gallistercoris]